MCLHMSKLNKAFARGLVFLLFGARAVFGQQGDYLSNGYLNAYVDPSGMLFNSPENEGFSNFPQSDSKRTLYNAHPWFAGQTQGNPWQLAGDTYKQQGRDFDFGPISNSRTSAYNSKYNRVWVVDQASINSHILNFRLPSYIMPEAIAQWPAHGDTSNGEAFLLAPFVDVNNNDIYDPEEGDYPQIRGTQALLFICNEVSSNHEQSGGPTMSLDVVGLVYMYEGVQFSDAVRNSLFIQLRTFNRSAIDYPLFRFGMFTDFDIGNFSDDYLAYDADEDMVYAYNADNEDEGATGYGSRIPAQGLIFLDELKMKSVHAGPIDPSADAMVNQSLNQEGNYIGGASGDVSVVAGSQPLSLGANDFICIDMAYVFAYSNDLGAQPSVQRLHNYAGLVNTFFETINRDCGLDNLSLAHQFWEKELLVYPQPANEQLRLKIPESHSQESETVHIYNFNGQLMYSQKLGPNQGLLDLNIQSWPPGVYAVHWGKYSHKLLIAR